MPTILVVGATGQQGGAVVQALLSSGRNDVVIRAISRNPQSDSALRLRERGVKVFKADLLDTLSLEAALRGCDAAYLVTDFSGPGDVAGETENGCTFVDTAKKAGVKHVVFSSVAGSEDPEVEHFYSKYLVEEHLRNSGLSWTIVRPVGFLEVIPPSGITRDLMLSFMQAVFGNGKQKWIACEDIGKTVARAFLEPENSSSKIYTICADVKSIEEVREEFAKVERREGWRFWIPKWLALRVSPYHYRQMFVWLAKGLQPGDPEETKNIVPDSLDVQSWIRRRIEVA